MKLPRCRATVAASAYLLLSSTLILPAPAQTGGLAGPSYDRLAPGIAGPQTNDPKADEGSKESGASPLLPIKMIDVERSGSGGECGGKASSINEMQPKGPAGAEAGSSKKNSRQDGSALKRSNPLTNAKRTGLMPLALQKSDDETDKDLQALDESERAEMTDLWEATLANSPDIQFVVDRLMPTSNHLHATTVLSRMLSTAIMGAVGTLNMVAPSPGTTAITQSGGNLLSSLLSGQDRKNLRKAQISEAEIIMLYKIVRDTADKLVENYRTYKQKVAQFERAVVDMGDFEGIGGDVKLHGGPSVQIEVDYILRHQRNDITGIRYDLRRYRQQIVDMAGASAAAKLDAQIDDEFKKTDVALPMGATPWDEWSKQVMPGS